MTMSMAALIETAQAQREREEAERVAQQEKSARAIEASKAADLAELKTLLGDMADEVEIELTGWEVGSRNPVYRAAYRVSPKAWHGVVDFNASHWSHQWQFGYYNRRNKPISFSVTRDEWGQDDTLAMVCELQATYEKARDGRIAVMMELLSDDRSDLIAAEVRQELMTLAPEREAEWGAALAAWQRRRDEREAAVAAYVQALGEWRAKYEQALAENRRVLAETQRLLDMEFTRYEIGLAVFYTDDDGRAYPARVNIWSLDNKAGKDGSWRVLDNGRLERRVLFNVLWVGEAVTETLMDAGDGPWRETIYVHEAGQSLYCTPWLAEAARRDIRRLMISLPAEPEPPEWVRDGLTAAERERIIEVTRGMAHVGIPF